MTDGVDHSEAFTDTCVLFDYVMDGREAARELFECHRDVRKVTSSRVQYEFESVSSRRQDIHRELLECAADAEIQSYEPSSSGRRSNDISYVIDLYNDLLELDDDVEVVRRLNELVNRLEKAQSELFEQGGLVLVLDVDGLDSRLKGLLSSVVENQADVRILCDAVAWRRSDGSGTFLSEDADDILGRGDDYDDVGGTTTSTDSDASEGLSDTFADFMSVEDETLPEQINDRISLRYDETAMLTILSVSEFVELLSSPASVE